MDAHAPVMSLVAQQGGGGALVWTGVLAVVIVIGCMALLHLRRRLLGVTDDTADGMTLEDLRRLHTQGRLSDEEFARLKDQLISASRPRERHATVEALKRRKGPPGPPEEPHK